LNTFHKKTPYVTALTYSRINPNKFSGAMKNTAVPVSPAVRRSGLPEYVRKDDIVIKGSKV
jgi:hypothetical protein